MNEIDHLGLMAEVKNDFCALNHGRGTKAKKVQAVNYIIQSFGCQESSGIASVKRDIIIPICTDCNKALQGNAWTLLYCFECTSNHWIARELSKNKYQHNILWLRGCPECSKKFGGVYFTDVSKKVQEQTLLQSIHALAQ